jgi:hypothetical protein
VPIFKLPRPSEGYVQEIQNVRLGLCGSQIERGFFDHGYHGMFLYTLRCSLFGVSMPANHGRPKYRPAGVEEYSIGRNGTGGEPTVKELVLESIL